MGRAILKFQKNEIGKRIGKDILMCRLGCRKRKDWNGPTDKTTMYHSGSAKGCIFAKCNIQFTIGRDKTTVYHSGLAKGCIFSICNIQFAIGTDKTTRSERR